MLSCHSEFLEHACISLWIAIDASLAIVLTALRKLGQMNPTARDAGAFLTVFDNECESEGYFKDY